MPIYEYRCTNSECDIEKFEEVQMMNDEHKAKCPECKRKADRVFTSTPFTFDFKYGWDAGLGEYANSKKDRERIMREKNLRRVS